MMPKDNFNPTDSAAMMTKSVPLKKKVEPTHLAALPPLLKNKPIIQPPKKPKVTIEQKPISDDEYFKKHPLMTEHADGTVRPWGEDTTARKSPYTLPKQILPPPTETEPNNKRTLDLSDKAKGYSDYYYRKNQ
jgi:hypothetical protein